MTLVVNCMRQEYDVYIGRPSKWGNPFTIGIDGNRAKVIRRYRAWILENTCLLNSLHELKGKRLGCFCAPKPCHGNVLVELIEEVLSVECIKVGDNVVPVLVDEGTESYAPCGELATACEDCEFKPRCFYFDEVGKERPDANRTY